MKKKKIQKTRVKYKYNSRISRRLSGRIKSLRVELKGALKEHRKQVADDRAYKEEIKRQEFERRGRERFKAEQYRTESGRVKNK